MSVPNADYLADDALWGLIVLQQMYRPSNSNKNVDIDLKYQKSNKNVDIDLKYQKSNKNVSHLVHITRLWNNLHQVRSKSKDW